MRLLLIVLSACLLSAGLLGACAKEKGPLRLYFVSSGRFTSGNRAGVGPGDTLSTRLYADANPNSTTAANSLTRFQVTVSYSPLRTPFVYPTPLTGFSYRDLPDDPPLVYLDTLLSPRPSTFLYTSVFGARTTSGTEKWTFTATDGDNNSSSRAFVLAVRRSDSLDVVHAYALRLPAVATGVAARRFIDLRAGLAYPRYSVRNRAVQQSIDLILLPDGQRLASPSDPSLKLDTVWKAPLRQTIFRLTPLTATNFANTRDTTAIRTAFVAAGAAANQTLLPRLLADQVYAFNIRNPANLAKPYLGLLHVLALPTGTTAGLQLEVRLAKQPR